MRLSPVGFTMATEIEMPLPLARLGIVHYFSDQPMDIFALPHSTYRLHFCLLPHLADARACFRDCWGPHRFELMGDLFLMPPGQSTQARSEQGRQSSLVCEFGLDALRVWLDGEWNWNSDRLRAILNIPSRDMRTSLLRLTDELRNPGFATNVLCESLTAQIIIDLARYCTAIGEIKTSGGLTPRRLRLIDERLADSNTVPGLEEIASLCDLSVRQLTRAFRISHGCSIGEYISRSQMQNAKRLLARQMSIKEISFSLGFASPSSFSIAFRRATGESPQKFRSRIRLN